MITDATYISFYFRSNTIRVFLSAIRSIGSPDYLRFRISGDKHQMVMEPFHKKEFTSFKVPRGAKNLNQMQIRGKRFCNMIIKELGYDPLLSYRIPGKIYEQQQIVLFDLERAAVIRERN